MSTAEGAPPSARASTAGTVLAEPLANDLLQALPFGVALLDAELRFTWVNAPMERLHDRPRAEHLGRRPSELFGALGALVEATARQVITEGSSGVGLEAGGPGRPAVPMLVLAVGRPAHGIALVAEQLSGLDAAREELARAEARYRSLADAGTLDVLHLDSSGRLVADTPRWRAETGLPASALLGAAWWSLLLADEHGQRGLALPDQPRPFDVELAAPSASGDRAFVARLVPVVREGVPVEWVGTVTDVTAERVGRRQRQSLLQAVAEAAARTSRLQQVTAALSTAVSVDEVCDTVLEQARAAVGARGGAVCLVQEDGRDLDYTRVDGWPQALSDRMRGATARPASFSSLVQARGTPTFVSTEAALRELLTEDGLDDVLATGDQAWCGLPLLTRGELAGVLALGFATEHDFSADEQTLLIGIAGQLAQALDRARLYDRVVAEALEARQSSARIEVLARATAALATATEPDAALAAMAGAAVPDLAELCAVWLVEPGERGEEEPSLRHIATAGVDGAAGAMVLPVEGGPIDRVLASAEPRLQTVTGSTALFDGPGGTAAVVLPGAHSLLLVPLQVDGATVGVLAMAAGPERAPYDGADVLVAVELAARGAAAVRHLRLFSTSQQTALTLQRSLLPARQVELEELEVAARYVPGTADTEVGGDWYDVVELGAGRVGLVIGDVMGRGVRAAAVMGQLRSAVRAYARQDLPPGEVLELLDGLVGDLDEAQLVTCGYGVYDPGQQELTLAVAGHPPPVLRSPDGTAALVGVDPGTPLGVGGGVFPETTVALPTGAVLALCTDGLVESRHEGVDDGLARLTGLLADHGAEGLEGLADTLLTRMGRASGHDDDIALLLVRVPTQSGVRTAQLALATDLSSIAEARAATHATLTGWEVPPDVTDGLVLLLSEVATNALLYGRPPVEVMLRRTAHKVVLEVRDRGWTYPRRRLASADDEGGRGLELVGALATRWGVRTLSRGKAIWMEVDLSR